MEIKNQLLKALGQALDEPLKAVGFTRNRRSFVYVRTINDAEQRITFILHCHPRYQPGAEAHLCPSLQLAIPKVSEVAMALVRGDKLLLAGTPEIIIGEPIEFVAPKDEHQRWFSSGGEEFVTVCESIKGFLFQWVLPFFAEVSTPLDLVKLYETNDTRIMKQKHWYIFVAAAYQILGLSDKARGVVQGQFRSPGLRKRYAPLFTSLGIE